MLSKGCRAKGRSRGTSKETTTKIQAADSGESDAGVTAERLWCPPVNLCNFDFFHQYFRVFYIKAFCFFR